MTARAVWLARGLRVLGLAAVITGIWLGHAWAVLAAAGGLLVAFSFPVASRAWATRRGTPSPLPSDLSHTLDLLRRAHGGVCAWAVGLADGELQTSGDVHMDAHHLRRGSAIVQLASVDGRSHVAREEEGTYVAAGDFPYGAGLLLLQPNASTTVAEAAVEDLRRFVAGLRHAELDRGERGVAEQSVAKRLAAITGGAQTLEAIARAGAELAQHLSQRGVVVLLADAATRSVRVVACSKAADRRLQGLTLPPAAPAVRAVTEGVPVASQRTDDIFGPGMPERRREERMGVAYPLVDGHFAVGALVLVGRPLPAGAPETEQIGRLVVELGPRLAAARAVHEAEERALLDPLTGLRNRREFERQLDLERAARAGVGVQAAAAREPGALIYVDLDHFKALNDSLGHAAGDAALRHVAGLLQAQVRDVDLVARIGGEEFAVWLPRAPLAEGMEVAERIRRVVEGTVWRWSGEPVAITASCGVAGYPESVADVSNLRSTADAALYRAKQGGRNRVEMAPPAG
jgi:diguanylate cyclase (GGDEF)-like protein